MASAVVIGGVRYEHLILGAAISCKTVDEVRALAASAVAGLTVGSVAYERSANNEGLMYYRRQLRAMVSEAAQYGKPLCLSVIGATVAEYIELAGLALDNKAEALELDLAGANTWLGQRPDSIVSDDPEAIARVIGAARRYLPRGYPISVKLSPYSDASLRAEVAAVLQEAPIQCVVMGNTHPGGAASVEARSTKAIALDQLRELWQLLPPEIPIIGVGGIETGADVRDFLDAGACAVQVDIAHLAAERRPSFFDELVADFEASV